jgi:xylulokinase
MFGCRTNGALVWDRVRALYEIGKDDYAPAEAALRSATLGQSLVLWQPREESFPASGSFDLKRVDGQPGLETDYPGIVESGLAAVYVHSREFAPRNTTPLYIMGGAAGSPGIVRRVAAIWDRPVVVTGKAGAALGAAVAGVSALFKSEGHGFDTEEFSAALVRRGEVTGPVPEDVAEFHRSGGYLDRFTEAEARLLRQYPLE